MDYLNHQDRSFYYYMICCKDSPEKNMAWVEKRAYFGFHFPALREPIASVGLNYWPHWQVNTKSGLD